MQKKIATLSFDTSIKSIQKIKINLGENYDKEYLEENTIAPGTEGEFNILINVNNEVGAKYQIMFENETKKPNNLKFIFDEKEYNSLKEIEEFLKGEILVCDDSKEKNINIKWIWKYETGDSPEQISKNDIKDTEDAKNIKEYRFDVIVEGIQLEPKK